MNGLALLKVARLETDTSIAEHVRANIRSVDPKTLKALKAALVPFNGHRKRWDCPRPHRLPAAAESE